MKAFDVLHARRRLLLVSAAYLFTPLSAFSAPRKGDAAQRLLSQLRQLHPGTEFTAVHPTPIAGWFEVWMGRNVAYVQERHPRYFVFGRLFDTQKALDLTPAAAPAQRTNVGASAGIGGWSTLPLIDAIEIRRGTAVPQRAMAVFSDPQCGHCRALESEIEQLQDLSVYVFLLPFQGAEFPRRIWCSPERAQAWQQWMRSAMPPPAVPEGPCDAPLERNMALAQRLGVQGTPTMFFLDGTRIEGAVSRQVIEERLQKAAAAMVAAGSRS